MQYFKKGAFERLFLVLLLLASACSDRANPAFSQTRGDTSVACTAVATETAVVRYVHDGDTLHLDDGRKIRLIGIDAPELARHRSPDQAYALAARDYLRQLVKQRGPRVGLMFDTQTEDRYGRTLAHLFFDNGDNVQAALIDAGLVIAYTTPPNSRLSACYLDHEARAQRATKLIWSHSKYRDQAVATLAPDSKGFHIVHARVLNSNHSSKGIWLRLKGGLSIQIKTSDLSNFEPDWLNSLKNKTIRVRGWLHPRRRHGETGFYMQLRHPDNLQVLASAT